MNDRPSTIGPSDRWELSALAAKNSKISPRKRTDSLRNLLNIIHTSSVVTHSLDAESAAYLNDKYHREYTASLDAADLSVGLNNYAESALSLSAGYQNDSDNWKCGLSLEDLKKGNPLWKEFQDECRKTQLDTHRPDEVYKLTKRNVTDDTQRQGVVRQGGGPVQQQAQSVAPTLFRNISGKRKQQQQQNLNPVLTPTTQGQWHHATGVKPPTREGVSPQYNTTHPSVKQAVPYNTQQTTTRGPQDDGNVGSNLFKSAREQLIINNHKKYGSGSGGVSNNGPSYGISKKSLGTRRGTNSKFNPPTLKTDDDNVSDVRQATDPSPSSSETLIDERLKSIDPKMIELIMNEIMDHGPAIGWDDIAGLEFAKNTIKEIVVWPMLRPDIFTGLRGPPKGILLFGPPGTGKTLIGKCIASQSKATFFSISASSLTSKWVGEGEKMVRALFAVSKCHQPAVIFIDEIDSLLAQRSETEHESSRRIKTEFLVQLDGATTSDSDRVLVVGATNRPQEIDEAARRRFVKRLYIPLPEKNARQQIMMNLLSQQKISLIDADIDSVCQRTAGYSGADMSSLCHEAALGPIRCINFADIETISPDDVRPITIDDFNEALKHTRASVSQKDLSLYVEWNSQYGCGL